MSPVVTRAIDILLKNFNRARKIIPSFSTGKRGKKELVKKGIRVLSAESWQNKSHYDVATISNVN